MAKFQDRLKQLRSERELSLSELAKLLKMSKSSINMYELGEREPNTERMEVFADFFNVDMDYLFGRTDTRKKYSFSNPQISTDTVIFPVIGEIAAGYDEIAIEDWSGETIEVPNSYLKGRKREDYLVLSVHGDSMYPHYQNGDKVLILKQPSLNSGEVGAVIYNDECATLKKIEYIQGEEWIKLIPLNPEYMPKKIEGADLSTCRIIGVPVLLIRNIQ